MKTFKGDTIMKKGQRVEIINGVLQGKQATIIKVDPVGWEGMVLLQFDDPAIATQWYEIEHLRAI